MNENLNENDKTVEPSSEPAQAEESKETKRGLRITPSIIILVCIGLSSFFFTPSILGFLLFALYLIVKENKSPDRKEFGNRKAKVAFNSAIALLLAFFICFAIVAGFIIWLVTLPGYPG